VKTDIHVESPCISLCILNTDSGFCEGCWRTRDEIALWRSASSEQRLAIITEMHKRRDQAQGVPANEGYEADKRNGGRRTRRRPRT